ncbi:alpha/beta hydrolase [Streptomyces cavernicola]|uniref:Alpha/beta hydrolase n=1 Tax=Streptomyces cavernicola TaxID=3043613 RepID=A0ABT6SI80_9ACTN|nr:alpha/beta hydrolase [Streptomyces sp. B-S-A6]MDI3407584.1 alpha/beta hydrolase [Streptomyces sp. B-S-A6]
MRTRCAIASAATLALLATTAAPATPADDATPDLTPFYDQPLTWHACKGLDGAPSDMRCGRVTVPLDYAAPEKGTLDLALNRIPASGKKRGSLLVNFGGPGGPGVAGLVGWAKQFGDLAKGYDVVGFDPRGVGTSSPVTCGDGSDMPDEPLADDASAVLEHAAEQWQVCRKRSGPVADHVGTVNVSRDLDVMREALGDDKLNFLGFSYGTRLGAVYTGQFPHKVGRMVLDGVDTLTEPMVQQNRVAVEGQQTALDNFATWCAQGGGCVLGDNSRDARQRVAQLVDQLNGKPIPLGEGLEYSGDDLVNSLGSALYHRDAWPTLAQALGNVVADRDPRALLRLSGVPIPPPDEHVTPPATRSGAGGIVAQDDIPPDNFGVALAMVNCADDPDRLTAAQLSDEKLIEGLIDDYTEASPIFGPARLEQVLLCAGQPKGTDFIRKIHDVDTPRFLLVGTRGDPATPYQWAVETAQRLGDQAVLLDNQGDGHTGYFSSKCVARKADDYLLYGELGHGSLYCGEE